MTIVGYCTTVHNPYVLNLLIDFEVHGHAVPVQVLGNALS
jgi:hypothetical protein